MHLAKNDLNTVHNIYCIIIGVILEKKKKKLYISKYIDINIKKILHILIINCKKMKEYNVISRIFFHYSGKVCLVLEEE